MNKHAWIHSFLHLAAYVTWYSRNACHRVPKCNIILAKLSRLLVPIYLMAKRWCGDHTSPKHSICPAPIRCLNDFAVNFMRMLSCFEPITWTTRGYDVNTSILCSSLVNSTTHACFNVPYIPKYIKQLEYKKTRKDNQYSNTFKSTNIHRCFPVQPSNLILVYVNVAPSNDFHEYN